MDEEDDVADLADTTSGRGEWGGYANGDGELAVASAMVRSGRGKERAREGAIPMGLGVASRRPERARAKWQAGGGRRLHARVGHALVLLAEEEDDRGGGGGGLGR